jgi:dolichol-phosphate mannosyltransferase
MSLPLEPATVPQGNPLALVIIPTYNEAENIERLVGEILALPEAFHVLIVDDNSPDGTGSLADSLASRDARVRVHHRACKLGLGTAHIAGFRDALARGYPLAVTMDADFSHNPRYLPALVALVQGADLAIGSRYVRGGGATGCSLSRVLISRGANALARAVLGLKAHDCTAGFRCYRAEVLHAVGIDAIFSNGYSFMVEMITRCQRLGYSCAELPIIFENRRLGASKISRAEIWKSFYTIARLRLTWLSGRKPTPHS